ncbi:hypothetical protein [Mesorhizobium sp. M0478]|uniref:hypothetical protein n=1 Tax=Mesorhizobium sp. M0478 TaxID=2956947 RepID=UPI003339C3C2
MSEIAAALRYLDEEFLMALDDLARSSAGNWWRDVLLRPDLVIAIRRNSINVYNHGASIFKVGWNGRAVSLSTHAKYLVKQEQNYIPLTDTGFEITMDKLFWRNYAGPKTLDSMIKAAKKLAGWEKTELHPMLVNDPRVIDAEIALVRATEAEKDEEEGEKILAPPAARRQDRLDAAVVRGSTKGPVITFYEAKHFSNGDLRALGDARPAVLEQITDYETALSGNAASLAEGYFNVARALLRISAMRALVAGGIFAVQIDPLVNSIAESSSPPIIDSKPRLLILGFDRAQRDDKGWQSHLGKLKSAEMLGPDRVKAVGSPNRNTRF